MGLIDRTESPLDEVFVARPSARALAIWRRASDEGYEQAPTSALLDVTAAELAGTISWPEETD